MVVFGNPWLLMRDENWGTVVRKCFASNACIGKTMPRILRAKNEAIMGPDDKVKGAYANGPYTNGSDARGSVDKTEDAKESDAVISSNLRI